MRTFFVSYRSIGCQNVFVWQQSAFCSFVFCGISIGGRYCTACHVLWLFLVCWVSFLVVWWLLWSLKAFVSFHFLKIHHRSTVSTIMKIVFIVYHCCYYWSIIINFSDVFSVCFDILFGGWVPVDAPSSGYVIVSSGQTNTSSTMVTQEAYPSPYCNIAFATLVVGMFPTYFANLFQCTVLLRL